ncbi:MAG: aromatic ring-hydroxylating dioxygenase subunit alpha [Planctomycetota bacterium]
MSASLGTHFLAVASSRELRRVPLGRRVGGQRLALARDSQGVPFALRDSCPHRGAPLSLGTVVGDSLECPYHGIQFSTDGAANSIPWSPAPCRLRARTYRVIEQDGLVFAASSSEAERPPLLEAPAGWRTLSLSASIDAPQVEVVENFMDSTHTGVVHTGLIRSTRRREEREVSVSADERSVTVEHTALDEDLGLARLWLGPGLISHRDTCLLPGTVDVEYFVNGAPFFRALVFVTPTGDASSEVFVRAAFGSPRTGSLFADLGRTVLDRGAGLFAPLIGRRVLGQDRKILEAVEGTLGCGPGSEGGEGARRPLAYQPGELMHECVRDLLRGSPRIGLSETVTLAL